MPVSSRRTRAATNAALTLAAIAVALSLTAAPARAAYVFNGFSAANWGASDVALGLTGALIEDFEDVNLLPGLQVQVQTGQGAYGPTGTLPSTFDPVAQDSFGNVFDAGVWDGTRALINTHTNQTDNYFITSHWGDVTFHFTGGASMVGFSLENMEHQAQVSINGVVIGNLPSLAGLSLGGGRNGYVRIDVTGASAPITTLKIDNSIGTAGDGITYDHLAFRPAAVVPAVPELGTSLGFGALLGLGCLGLVRTRRNGKLRRS